MKGSQEEDFEQKAAKILSYLNSERRYDDKFLPRPFFLEFTGSPSAGKTTTIKELDTFFRKQGFRVLCPQEGAEVIRHIPRSTPVYNIRTGLYALNLLLDLSSGHNYDIVIFDRAVFDVYCWMMYWQGKNKLSTEETNLIQSFFLSPLWMNRIDVAYFMVSDPKTAMDREMRIALSNKVGETTNPDAIATLAKRYRDAYQTLSPNYPQLNLLDTTKLTEYEMVHQIATNILNLLEQKTKNG